MSAIRLFTKPISKYMYLTKLVDMDTWTTDTFSIASKTEGTIMVFFTDSFIRSSDITGTVKLLSVNILSVVGCPLGGKTTLSIIIPYRYLPIATYSRASEVPTEAAIKEGLARG